MQTLARWVQNRTIALAIVVVALVVASFAAWHAVRVGNDDDLLAFLPADNPDVRAFYDINDRFGGTDVALVGIEVDDPFDPVFLANLQKVTRQLKMSGGLSYVLSLANVVDFTADEASGGIITANLVSDLPKTDLERAALQHKVMSRDHVVGNLIAEDGKAVLLYCFLAHGTEPRAISGRIKSIIAATFPAERLNWGGNPFISSYVYDTVQEDLRRLSPWAVIVIVLLMLLSLRSLVATGLSLVSTSMAIAVTIGLMQVLGFKLNLMLGAMPIVLFAIGCTYSIHVLLRYFDWRKTLDAVPAITRTLTGIGPVVLVAGATAAAAIASFVVMDIVPIRTFGLFTAVGIIMSVVFALTFVPAALRLTAPEQRRLESGLRVRRWLVRVAVYYQTRRRAMGASILLVALIFGGLILRVQTGVDQSSFFSVGSPPDRADQFLKKYFGAAQFVQLMIDGDMSSPPVLREVQSLADQLELLPHITGVQHVGVAISTINQAMSSQRRIPDTAGQVGNLYTFLAGDSSINQLVTPDHKQALLQIKVDSSDRTDVGEVLEAIQALLTREALAAYVVADSASDPAVAARRETVLRFRLTRLAKRYGVTLKAEVPARLTDFLALAEGTVDVAPVVARVQRFLRSSECAVPVPPAVGDRDPAATLAQAVVALKEGSGDAPLISAIARALALAESDPTVQDLAVSIPTPLADAWTVEHASQRATKLTAALGLELPAGERGERFHDDLTMAVIDWSQAQVLMPAAAGAATGGLAMQLNGLPVLYRGLANSVQRNQIYSLSVAVLLVMLILSLMLGSIRSGLVASAPTLFTLIIVHGAMGLFKIHLDVGTSLLGSLIIANGVDYAVHMIAAWETPEEGSLMRAAACAADRAGPGIWASAATMFVGFFVLTLGEARVLQNVTGLKATAMLVGAISTFAIVPVLARRKRYMLFHQLCDEVEPSTAVDEVLLAQEAPEKPA